MFVWGHVYNRNGGCRRCGGSVSATAKMLHSLESGSRQHKAKGQERIVASQALDSVRAAFSRIFNG
ncbi:hypothetical protein TI01_2017 [Lysobacter sp. A03]|nr:hypothetical protein TI01_2017 [Lysobacter sp. A03]